MRRKSGFTLIEVLVVVVVIVLIAGIALPRFLGVTTKGREARARGDLHLFKVAIESLMLHENPNPLPEDMDALLETLSNTQPRILGSPGELFDPFEPAGTRYGYYSNGQCYVLFSTGPDAASQITGVGSDCIITPPNTGDDIFVTNGEKA